MAKSKKNEQKERSDIILAINGMTNGIDKLTNAVLMQNSLLAKIGQDITELNKPVELPHELESESAHCCEDCDECDAMMYMDGCMYDIDDVMDAVDNIRDMVKEINDFLIPNAAFEAAGNGDKFNADGSINLTSNYLAEILHKVEKMEATLDECIVDDGEDDEDSDDDTNVVEETKDNEVNA